VHDTVTSVASVTFAGQLPRLLAPHGEADFFAQ
jgi:hypothetical protein